MKKLTLLILLASISCGGGNESTPPVTAPASTPAPAASSSAPSTPAPTASASPAPATSASAASATTDAPVAWKDMNQKQKGKFMRENVVPKMKDVFTAHDAKKFSKFGCGTCHGAGASDGSFKMPNPQLPVLPATKEGFEALGKKQPDMMKFMSTQVEPEMVKLLGVPEMDPKNPSAGGFSCGSCHTMKK